LRLVNELREIHHGIRADAAAQRPAAMLLGKADNG
jgi:hypothetical protein